MLAVRTCQGRKLQEKMLTEFRPRSSLRETTCDFSVRVNLAVKPRPGQPPAANEMKPSPWRPPIRVFALVDAWPRKTHQAQGRNVLTLSSNLRHVLLVEWRKRLKKWVELLCHVSTDRVYYQSSCRHARTATADPHNIIGVIRVMSSTSHSVFTLQKCVGIARVKFLPSWPQKFPNVFCWAIFLFIFQIKVNQVLKIRRESRR